SVVRRDLVSPREVHLLDVFDPSPPPELFCPVPTAASCPRSLDCALQRREFCPPGSGACGPCLPPFQEDDRGRCVQKQLSPNGRTSVPSLEAEIDFLADVLAKQEAPRHHPPQDGRSRSKSSLPAPSSTRDPMAARPCSTGRFAPLELARHCSIHVKYGQELERAAQGGSGVTIRESVQKTCGFSTWGHGLVVDFGSAGLMDLILESFSSLSASLIPLPLPGRLQKEIRLAQKADYSAQRVASPPAPGDKTLAQSAQMYHYQHQKQQMLSLEKHKEEPKLPDSASSDEENEDGDFTVYECPGLAPVCGCRRARSLCAYGGVQHVPGMCTSL
uniref:Neural proliferation, differentiation and control 1 n=1 Tax=Catharus ustulatus TaxID=91951 RepID=A0A8C3VBS4_CATUS